jgi:hypothetical protein
VRRIGPLTVALVVVVVATTAAGDSVEDFVRRHWRAPLPPQGPAPARFTAVEVSLAPEACGTCHPAQLADWTTSVHARAMGPGVTGQLADMLHADPRSATTCFRCHAPLAEQAPLVRRDGAVAPNPALDPALTERGVVCAACHVRAHERFGPPRRDGTVANPGPRENLPHGGVTRTSAFLRSEFCRDCHQFTPDQFRLNGKLLENTYAEWKASRYARDGVQCQDCHMPDRRHLWRGIHDPEMVRSGVTVALDPASPAARRGGSIAATLRVTNSGVGHAFPTYVTPRVVMRAELVDAAGETIAGSRVERTIERAVETNLSREVRDTRLLPGRSASLVYRRRVDARAARVRFRVIVEPDAFYTRFFETVLKENIVEMGAGRGRGRIEQALDDTRRSPFTLFERELAVAP